MEDLIEPFTFTLGRSELALPKDDRCSCTRKSGLRYPGSAIEGLSWSSRRLANGGGVPGGCELTNRLERFPLWCRLNNSLAATLEGNNEPLADVASGSVCIF